MSEYEGPERREGYAELEKKLNDHADLIAARFQRWFRAGLVIVGIIGFTSFAALFGFGYALRQIQNQRKAVCQSQNIRHDRTIAQFRKETDDLIRKQPERELQIRRSVSANIRIIDQLLPKQDCSKVVKSPQ